MASRFLGQHILSAKQFSRSDLEELFRHTLDMRQLVKTDGASNMLHGKVITRIFYEPSTRTGSSFDIAAKRLGAVVEAIDGVQYSSVAKGEDLPDTVRTLAAYSDAVVLRHPVRGSAAEAASFIKKPLINAGDGDGEHPTQALLDLFTILIRRGELDGLTVTMMGDLRFGRTIHALLFLLKHFHVTVNLLAPEPLKLPSALVALHGQNGLKLREISRLEDVMAETDVLYVTRAQYERFKESDPLLYESVKQSYQSYTVTPDTLSHAKSDLVLMHPFPRNDEISREVDTDPRFAIFEQIENGMYLRMALFAMILGRV
jgi:aspartate carbamoyltransferase